MVKYIDHIEYPKRLTGISTSQLWGIIDDCRETLKAMPHCENAGYYLDEISYCYMELSKRRRIG